MQQLLGFGIYSLKGTNKKLTHNVKILQYCLYREGELKQDLYAFVLTKTSCACDNASFHNAFSQVVASCLFQPGFEIPT